MNVGYRTNFTTLYEQYGDREGQLFTVVAVIDEADHDHDAEVLPMYRIRFEDGVEIDAWPEEVLGEPSGLPFRTVPYHEFHQRAEGIERADDCTVCRHSHCLR